MRSSHSIPFLLLLALPCAALSAAQLKEARVSQIIHDVRLLPQQAAPRPARVSDEVREGTAVRTGLESRAELTFTDATLARLGANTIFSFDQGTRNLQLGGGAMLLRVPKNAGGAQINTAAITAAITGTTMLIEYHPDAFCKYIMLEGVARIFRNNKVGESVLLHAGQMLIVNPNGKGLPEPVDVDLERLMKTSILITGFGPLPSTDLIAQEISQQDAQKTDGGLIETNLVIFNSGTIVPLLDPTNTNVQDQANANETRQPQETPTPPPSTPTPTPTPEKFGTPTVIASSTPYVIGSGTTIQTDPSITTNGVTDFGKIYRGPVEDGSISTYLFTATSAFDNFLQFDARFQVVDLLPLAVFKFSSLQLTGNPTISLVNGGAPNLALVSVGDITSGPPGGTLTFAGLASLIIATQDGSITLTSDLAFQDIASLGFYARGAGSNLTLDSAISGTTNLFLGAEGSIIANDSLSLVQTNSGVDLGLFTVVFAGENFTLGNSLTIVNDNSGGADLTNGGSIIINVGGDFSVAGDNTLTLNVLNNGGSDLGIGGDISVITGGDLTAGAIDALINNRDGGSIDDGGNLSFNIGGDLTTSGDATFVVSGRNDGLGGGTFGSGVSVTLSAASVSTGGLMDLAISVNAGGFTPSAFLSVDVPGSVVANGGYFSEIQSTGFSVPGGPFIEGSTISGDASLLLNFGSLTSGDVFDIEIDNFGAGTIGGEALLSVALTGDLNAASDIFTDIINTAANHNGVLSPGGTIGANATVVVSAGGDIIAGGVGEFAVLNNDLNFLSEAGTIMGDALVSLSATNITTGGFFQPLVNNTNGTIGGSASVFVTTTGDIDVGAETFFNILNTDGSIGAEALSTLVGNNFATGTTFQFQILNDGGSIGGSALLTADLNGALTIGGDATIQIGNNTGSIGQDATIDFNLGSFSANSLLLQIDNTGGFIGGTSNINFSTDGDVTITGEGAFTSTVNNSLGGQIGTGGEISLSATDGALTAGSIAALIDNSSGGSIDVGGNISFVTGGDLVTTSGGAAFTIQNTGGTIGTGGNLTLTVGGNLATQALTLFVENYDDDTLIINPAGHIGTGGNLFVSTGGNLTADSIDALINNRSGGTIDSGVNLTFSIGGSLTTTDDAGFTISTRFDDLAPNGSMLASSVGGDATVLITASSVNIGGNLNNDFFGVGGSGSGISNSGSILNGNATYTWDVSGDFTIQGDATLFILNDADVASSLGGTLHGNATILVNAANLTAGSLLVYIDNRNNNTSGGVIDSDATISFNIAGNLSIAGDVTFQILNNRNFISTGDTGGTIGSDAMITVTAASVSTTGSLFTSISNHNDGTIGGNALIDFGIAGDISSQSDATFQILNNDNGSGFGGGAIAFDATIDVSAASLSAASLTAQIINDPGGTIGGNATINMNVSGPANVTNDATVQILGSDAAAAAAININGGSYDAGGTFLALTDGDGAITFNNAAVHADILKVGALGTNGTLTIGGGSLSGDTTLQLYAGGSNGKIDFVANVSLSSLSDVAIIAANTVTIENGVLVTTQGSDGVAASVFTDVPNYTGSGGNGTKTGMFAGDGAVTSPFDQAPPFDAPGAPEATATGSTTAVNTTAPTTPGNPGLAGNRGAGSGAITHHGPRPVATVRIADSNELLDLVARVASNPTESARHRSNAPAGTGNVLSGKRRPTPSARLILPDAAFSRNGARRPAALP